MCRRLLAMFCYKLFGEHGMACGSTALRVVYKSGQSVGRGFTQTYVAGYDLDILQKRDQKGLYSGITEEKQKEVVARTSLPGVCRGQDAPDCW